MVGTLRRFSQPIMIFVTAFVIITFVWWTPSWYAKSGKGAVATVINGKPVGEEVYQREKRRLQIFARLATDRLSYFYAITASTGNRNALAGVENSLLFEEEADALGITATEEEIQDQLMNRMWIFKGADGKFDPAKFDNRPPGPPGFVQYAMNPEGFNVGEIDHFLRGEVRIRKVLDLLASTYPATPFEVKEQFLQSRLTTEASYVAFQTADLQKEQKVTDEELKKRYEENKDFLKTAEKRKVRIAAFALPPVPPTPPTPPTPGAKPPEDAERNAKLQALAYKAYDMAVALTQPGADFDEQAKKDGAALQETKEFFSEEEGPAELEASQQAAAEAFKLTKEKPFSAHITLKNGTYVLALKEIKPPEQLTFEQARKQLETEMLAEKADTAMRKKAGETREKLAAELKAGKSFSDAVQALGLKAEPFPAFSLMKRPPPGTKYNDLVPSVTQKLAPGEISEVIPSPEGALIVHVDHRPAVDEKGMAEAGKEIADRIEQMHRAVVFAAWIEERRQAAGLKALSEQ